MSSISFHNPTSYYNKNSSQSQCHGSHQTNYFKRITTLAKDAEIQKPNINSIRPHSEVIAVQQKALSNSSVVVNIRLNLFASNAISSLGNSIKNQLQLLKDTNATSIPTNKGFQISVELPRFGFDKHSITIEIGGKQHQAAPRPRQENQPEFASPKAEETISRLAPADEAAKTGELSGKDRPTPRDISNAVADQKGIETKNDNNASDLLWSWGQFIDHDMVLTKEGKEAANISVPKGDRGLDPTGSGRVFIPFTRSQGVTDENGVRQQINEQTPLIDASMVYGATEHETQKLRSFSRGEMKIDNDGFLPFDPDTMVLAGDKRAAEQPGLLSLHTLFVREHNRQAKMIATENPLMSDEAIFNKARQNVAAQIQAITYNEFLPVLIGEQNANPANFQIDPATNDGKVSNEFATAAYRLGHTLVSDTIAVKQKDGSLKQATLDEVFFKPDFTRENGIGSVLAGQSEQTAERVDNQIVASLRDKLFGPPGSGAPGLDLASLNIQRGRDHNLPSYNDMREALGMKRIESFNDPIFQDGVGEKLASVYASPDEMDLWAGGLAEQPYGNSMLGETFTRIVADQFAKTAQADENFYTRSMSAEDQAWLSQLTLADVIRANSDDVMIDDTAFIVD